MVVALFRSLEGESLEDVSIRLAERWRVGQKGLDNGVILVVFVDDRKSGSRSATVWRAPCPTRRPADHPGRDRAGFREGRTPSASMPPSTRCLHGSRRHRPPNERVAPSGLGATQIALLFVVAVIAIMVLSAVRRARGRAPAAYTYSRGGWGGHPSPFPRSSGVGVAGTGAVTTTPEAAVEGFLPAGVASAGAGPAETVVGKHPAWVRSLFAEGDLEAIADAVKEAERGTSAEIRVDLERRLPRSAPDTAEGDALRRAREVFVRLGMHRTTLRHGVLIYVALADHRVAIVGDEGIHQRVGDTFWMGVRDLMVNRLRGGAAGTALVEAIRELGPSLARHFPRQPGDTNELSDSVSLS